MYYFFKRINVDVFIFNCFNICSLLFFLFFFICFMIILIYIAILEKDYFLIESDKYFDI
jgi:hypothetical protein